MKKNNGRRSAEDIKEKSKGFHNQSSSKKEQKELSNLSSTNPRNTGTGTVKSKANHQQASGADIESESDDSTD